MVMGRRLFVIIVLIVGAVFGLAAHPHVFITNRLTFIFDEGGLQGIEISWDFNEGFSAMIKQNFDRNQNGLLEDAEVELVRKGTFPNLKNFNYFTFLEINGDAQRVPSLPISGPVWMVGW